MILFKKHYKSEVSFFEYGYISVKSNYVTIVFYDYSCIQKFLTNFDKYTVKWLNCSFLFKNLKFIPKKINIFLNNSDLGTLKYCCFSDKGYNKFYYREIKRFLAYKYKINNIYCWINEKLEYDIINIPRDIVVKELNVHGCRFIHNVENIQIYFNKKTALIALMLCRLRTHISLFELLSYSKLIIKFGTKFINLIDLSDFQILKIISDNPADKFCFEFSLTDVDDHTILYNNIIMVYDKYTLRDDLLYNYLN